MKTEKIPHFPQKMNILGRKRYSVDSNAVDVINYSFDDCWRAIGLLWSLLVALTAVVFRNQLKQGLNQIINLLNAHGDIDVI